MKPEIVIFYLAMLACLVLGLYLLVRTIATLMRMSASRLRHRFAPTQKPQIVHLPKPGRYTINVVFPPFSFITGRSHFSATFQIKPRESDTILPYQTLGLALLTANKTDMNGNTSYPLGHFECPEKGDYQITCLNPQNIRSGFQIEVAPFISPLKYVPLILGIILGAFLMIGAMIISLLKMAGKI